MDSHTSRSFVIRLATSNRSVEILEFHKKYLNEHLWPRTLKEFQKLIDDERLYEAIEFTGENEALVGICYIKTKIYRITF